VERRQRRRRHIQLPLAHPQRKKILSLEVNISPKKDNRLKNPYSQFRQSQLESTPKLKLIVMLYDGAIRFLQQSVAPMRSGDFEQKGVMINKAIDILYHLTGTLNHAQGGELAHNLSRIYSFMIKRLVEANLHNSPEMIEDVISLMKGLRDAWSQIAIKGQDADHQVSTFVQRSTSDLSLAA
jgi:flagellar protein FliS